MYAFWIQVISFILIFIGVVFIVTQRYFERVERREERSGSHSGVGMPGDIHDYSGWGHGGVVRAGRHPKRVILMAVMHKNEKGYYYAANILPINVAQ